MPKEFSHAALVVIAGYITSDKVLSHDHFEVKLVRVNEIGKDAHTAASKSIGTAFDVIGQGSVVIFQENE